MSTGKQTRTILTSLIAVLILSSPCYAAETTEKPRASSSGLVDKIGELGSNAAGGIYYFSGLSLIRSGKYKQALSELNKAIEFCPKNGAFFKSRGVCYSLMDQDAKCVDEVTQAIKLGDNSSDCYSVRARAYFELKDFAKCSADIAEAIRLDPNDANAHLLQAMCSLALYDTDKASRSMERAFELDPLLDATYSKTLNDAIATIKGYNESSETVKKAQAAVTEAQAEASKEKEKPTEKTKLTEKVKIKDRLKLNAAHTTGSETKVSGVAHTKPSFHLPKVLVYTKLTDASAQEHIQKEPAKPVPAHTVETFSGGAFSIREFDKDGHPINQE